MKKKALVLIMVFAALAIMAYGVIGSGAWFTDSATSTASTIHTGTLSIHDGALTQATISVPNLAPGETTGDAVFTIYNDGNVNLAWFGDLILGGTDDSLLKDVIYIDFAQMEFLGPTGTWEPIDPFIENGVGSGPYDIYGWFDSIAALSTDNVVTLKNFDGNNGMGSTPFEFMGALKPEYAYRLTMRFGMVESAGNQYQNKGPITITLKVDAAQITKGALDGVQTGFGTNHLTWLNQQIAKQH